MNDRENLPAKITSQEVAVLTEQRGSLVARGLAAVRDRERQSLSLTTEPDAEKLFRQGMRYRWGDGDIPEDDDKAREYLLAAAKLNHAEAQYELGSLLYEYSEEPEGLQWLKCSAHLGFGPAQYLYAKEFERLDLPLSKSERDELMEKAFAWHEERAQAGDAERQCDLAQMHFEGEAEAADHNEGMRWLKASAAQDYPEACYLLGYEYLDGKITEHTTQQGIYWLSRAADLGVARACESLGNLYLLGHTGSRYDVRQGRSFSQRITPDKKLAVAWYERGIGLGRRRMACNLGKLYLLGEFLDQDLVLAEKWLLHAATDGDNVAQLSLGSEYASGKQLKLDADAAIRWLTASGLSWAKLKLADIYRKGEIVPKNPTLAVEWLTSVIDGEVNTDAAMKVLALMYANGEIGEPDQDTAQEWYRRLIAYYNTKRAKIPDNPSLYAFELAGLYESGEGVEKDQNKAIELYKQAAKSKHPNPDAIKRLHELGITL